MSQQITIPGPGDTLAERYEILDELGRGSYGVVFKARDIQNEKLVAIKTLLPQSVLDPEVIDRFTREAQLVSRLDHPNVISLYDYGQRENLFYMVVEYIEGRSLTQLIEQDAPLPPQDAEALVSQILGALVHAHGQGIVHRDLKPENILLQQPSMPGGQETVKILDFGIAKLVRGDGDEFKTLTQAGHVLGTPHYMSPEQISGDEVSHHADLYSVGIILYELLVGEHPFEGTTSTAVMVAHLRDDPPPLPGALEHGKWGEAVRGALIKQPWDRLESAQLFFDIITREESIEEATQVWEALKLKQGIPAPGHLEEKTALYEPLQSTIPIGASRAPVSPAQPPMPSFGAEPAHHSPYSPVDESAESTRTWSKDSPSGQEGFSQLQDLRAGAYGELDPGIADHIPSIGQVTPASFEPPPPMIEQKQRSSAPLIVAILAMFLLFGGLVSYLILAEEEPRDAQAALPPKVGVGANTSASRDTTPPRVTTPKGIEAARETSATTPVEKETSPAEETTPEVRETTPKKKVDKKKVRKARAPDKPSTIAIKITSSPNKSNVFVGDELVGRTPYTLEVERGSPRPNVRVESIGHQPKRKKLDTKRDNSTHFKLEPKSLLTP